MRIMLARRKGRAAGWPKNVLSYSAIFLGIASVLKCKFYYYLDKVRPTDQETIVIEKIVPHHNQEEGALLTTQGATPGSTGLSHEA